jgi:hypothetical protein
MTPQRDGQMFPDHATRKPLDDLAEDIDRIGEEERRQPDAAENRHAGEQLPQTERDDCDQQLQGKKDPARHQPAPTACVDWA